MILPLKHRTALALAVMIASGGYALAQPLMPAAMASPGLEASSKPATLTLTASADVKLPPDMASLQLSVQTEAPNAREALRSNAFRMTQVIATLKKGGIAAKDVQTSGLSLSPQYAYAPNLPPKLTGYQVSNQISLVINDLARLGEIIDAAVNSGANNLGTIGFSLADPQTAEDAARLAALKSLQAKADLYAHAAGYRTARLTLLSEGGGFSAPPAPMMATMKSASADSTPVEVGLISVRIDIGGTFELVR